MYCLTATAKKNNMRLITVVMGEPDSTTRSSETVSMLDYGFNTYEINTLLSKNTVLKKVYVSLGKDEYVNVAAIDDINILDSKIGTKRNVSYEVKLNNIKAPVKVGDSVGKINVIEDNKILYTVDATVVKDIGKANIFKIYLRNIEDIISGAII